jgi:hypothetical protein
MLVHEQYSPKWPWQDPPSCLGGFLWNCIYIQLWWLEASLPDHGVCLLGNLLNLQMEKGRQPAGINNRRPIGGLGKLHGEPGGMSRSFVALASSQAYDFPVVLAVASAIPANSPSTQ